MDYISTELVILFFVVKVMEVYKCHINTFYFHMQFNL